MKKYHGIQVLRFVAAGMVVIAHMSGNVIRHWGNYGQLTVPPLGGVGVFVFFGISGFIMVSTQYESFEESGSSVDFFLRRLLRILPIYAIATGLQYINKFNVNEHYNWLNLIKSLAFIPYVGELGFYRPVLGQGWTLNVEMFFYLVFAVCLIFSRRIGLTLCMAIFVLFAACSDPELQKYGVLSFYADRILLYFVCGMLVAVLHRRYTLQFDHFWLPLTASLALMAGALLIALEYGDEALPTFCFNVVMVFCVVWLAASYRSAQHSKSLLFFERLGDASYSTYLFHGFVVGALKILAFRIGDGNYLAMTALCILSLVLANAAGMIAYQFGEQPIARVLRRFTGGRHVGKRPTQSSRMLIDG